MPSVGVQHPQTNLCPFIGRRAECARFQAFLHDPALRMLRIIGPGGAGKSTLLGQFARDAETAGWRVVRLGARQKHTEESFPDGSRCLYLADELDADPQSEAALLQKLLLQLQGDACIVAAGRRFVMPAWRDDATVRSCTVDLHLRFFTPEETALFLQQTHVPEDKRQRVARLSRGNPLVLSLITDLIRRGASDAWAGRWPKDALPQLVERLVGSAPSPQHRKALLAAATVRSIDEDLLRAVVGQQAGELYDWLRDLSYVSQQEIGLHMHDLVADLVRHYEKSRAPQAEAQLREQLRSALVHMIARAPLYIRVRLIGELFFVLRDSPAFQAILGGWAEGWLYLDDGLPDDLPLLEDAVRRFEGHEAAAAFSRLQADVRSRIFVVRDEARRPKGFLLDLLVDSSGPGPADHLVAAGWAAAEALGRLRKQERARLVRFWMDLEHYQSPGPVQARLFAQITALNLGTPGLAIQLACHHAPDMWEPLAAPFRARLFRRAEQNGNVYGWFGYDWRSEPISTWLQRVTHDFPDAPPGTFAGPLPPVVQALSRREFDAAVAEGLRRWGTPERLAASPLISSRMILNQVPLAASEDRRVETLRTMLRETAEGLSGDERHARL